MDIGTKELRKRLSEILDRVERGERVRIVRRGRPAAELTAVEKAPARRLPSRAALRARVRVRRGSAIAAVIAARREARY